MSIRSGSYDENRSLSGRYSAHDSHETQSLGKPMRIHYSANSGSIFDESDGDDLEFDDTQMETPKVLRNQMRKTDSLNGLMTKREGLSSTSRNRSDEIHHDMIMKLPLNDENGATSFHRNISTPISTRKASMYGARNGTPRRVLPFARKVSSHAQGEDAEEDEEGEFIRSQKLISEDNNFSPRRASKSRVGSSSGQIANLTPKSRLASTEVVSSVPTSFKVRPPKSLSFETQHVSNTRSSPNLVESAMLSVHDDIEFDSSDSDDIELAKRNPFDVQGNDPEEHMSDLAQKAPLRRSSGASDINKGQFEPPIPSLTSRSQKENLTEVKSLPNSRASERRNESSPKGPEDISRADLLERINMTINSIRDSSDAIHSGNASSHKVSSPIKRSPSIKFTSPVKNPSPLRNTSPNNYILSPQHNEEDIDDEREVESIVPGTILNSDIEIDALTLSDSQEDILHELDFRLSKKPGATSNHSNVDSRPLDMTAFRQTDEQSVVEHESLADKYEMSRIGFQTSFDTSLPKILGSPERLSRYRNEIEEWSSDKWLKLMKVIDSPNLSKNDLLNSDVLLQGLGCSSRHELRQRINFLLDFKLLKKKARGAVSHKNKRYKRRPKKVA
ncbi:uncharacterized protein PRCAT00003974001 [Priceomyces carsonii]|uniref:uncharacterized protein n=1 Tax=Priceomyces carsonii TaxID=28549 RepID=UPI002ED893E9|nr:unnamed protein product [Priceomyces carsonii]